MKKFILCLMGCIFNYIVSIIGGIIILLYPQFIQLEFLTGDFILIFEAVISITCVATGVFYINLDLDKLFLKQEKQGFQKWERIVIILEALIIAGVLAFTFLHNFTNISLRLETSFNNNIRFVALPIAVAVNSILGTACLFAAEYCRYNVKENQHNK